MARTAGSHSQITGPRIEAAALKLFAQHGFAAVSMRQIAQEVGVQAGALYNYIPDKQTLLADLMVRHMKELLAAWKDDDTAPAMVRLEQFVRFHIDFNFIRQDAVFISYMELRNLTEENYAKVEVLRREYEDRLNSVLSAGLKERTMEMGDSKVTTFAVISMLTGINTWFREAGRLSLVDVQDIYWDMVRKAVAV